MRNQMIWSPGIYAKNGSSLGKQIRQAMNGEPLRCKVTISNPQGFHMRPQSAFAQVANKFQSQVFLSRVGGKKVDGKSPFSLFGIMAEQGTELVLEVFGPDQEGAMKALVELMSDLSQFDSDPESEHES